MSASTFAIALLSSVGASVLTLGALEVFDRTDRTTPSAQSGDQSVSATVADTHQSAPQAQELAAALEGAAAERSQLSNSLREMNQRINVLSEKLAAAEALATPDGMPISPHTANEDGSGQSFGFPMGDERGQRDQLIAAGVDQSTADSIEQRQNRYQLDRLELIDQAAREGWRDSDEFAERLAALDEERVDVREELGDDVYDRVLYEQGGSNRVGIESVIGGSAAALAGIRSGDMIVSYADGRVFRLPELQAATQSGARGEYVQVTVDRDGELIALDVPRGPLGVTLRRLRREPS